MTSVIPLAAQHMILSIPPATSLLVQRSSMLCRAAHATHTPCLGFIGSEPYILGRYVHRTCVCRKVQPGSTLLMVGNQSRNPHSSTRPSNDWRALIAKHTSSSYTLVPPL